VSRLLRKIDDLEKDVSALRREAHDATPEAAAKTLEAQRRERISWGARMGSWAWKHLAAEEAEEAKRIFEERNSHEAIEERRRSMIESEERVGHEYLGQSG